LVSVSASSDGSGFGKFVPLLSVELRRGRVLGEMVNVVLLVQWFGMHAGALIDESDQMHQCVPLFSVVITVTVCDRSYVKTPVRRLAGACERNTGSHSFILYLHSVDPILVTITSGYRNCQSKVNILRLTLRNTISKR
jgi:hypothetical protein